MIQIAPAPASPAPAAPRAAPAATAGASGFAIALATILTPGAAAETDEAAETLLPGRQALAAGGKKLPGLDGKPGDADKDGDGEPDAPDAAFAWFAAPVVAEPVRTGFSAAARPVAQPAAAALPGGGPFASEPPVAGAAKPQPAPASGATPPAGDAAPAVNPPVPLPAQPVAPVAVEPKPVFQAKDEAPKADASTQPVALPAVDVSKLEVPTLANRPMVTPPTIALDAPAAQRRVIRDIAGTTFAPAAPDAPSAPAIAAPADMQQAALDTRRHEWMGSMIDRIEAMRDASNTGDTRIRLSPEALGQVDISIRHEGDRVHVHFATETPAARQLLTDAQPRLSELAEARGVKLGQTSVDSGTAGSGQHQTATRQPPVPARPASAVVADAAADTDQRIA
ncbi:MAG: flagellar hook-length control protein FliK [Sphingomonas sp.]